METVVSRTPQTEQKCSFPAKKPWKLCFGLISNKVTHKSERQRKGNYFSICFNQKISFDNINSNIPSADLHQIKRDISRKGEGRTRQISKMELIFTILDVGKGPEFACKCHKSQQGVSFVSSHAATGNTGEKCYETLHSSKFSLGLLHLVKDLAVQYQQEKLKNKA